MSARRTGTTLAAGLVALGAALAASPARAAEDGLYGRFDGDLDLRGNAGVEYAPVGGAFTLGASALYLSTGGLYLQYADTLNGRGSRLGRSLAAGVTLCPLFLARYASDWEKGPAQLDLLVDSLALQIGTFWSAPPGLGLRAEPGLEVALGASLPILPRASGPFFDLRGGMRLVREDLAAYGAPSQEPGARFFFSIAVAWHQVVATHLVDAGDRAPR
ncbi:MAG: hypothetical protein U0359_06775 [Byssovorax sp.]